MGNHPIDVANFSNRAHTNNTTRVRPRSSSEIEFRQIVIVVFFSSFSPANTRSSARTRYFYDGSSTASYLRIRHVFRFVRMVFSNVGKQITVEKYTETSDNENHGISHFTNTIKNI